MIHRPSIDDRPDGGTVLVLGGGGARGFAHFGVLKVLEDLGIRIDRIVGVSIGAFVGAVYCRQPDATVVTQRVKEYVESDRFAKYYDRMTRASRDSAKQVHEDGTVVEGTPGRNGAGLFGSVKKYLKATMAFHRFVMRQAILTNKPMEDCLDAVTRNGNIEDLAIPLTVVAADLRSGSGIKMETGDIFSAVLGSTALPGIFPPVERNGHLLADYGVLCSLPVSTALHYRPSTVIAVDLTPEIESKVHFPSGLEIVNRMEEIGCFLFKEHIASAADVVIKPEVGKVDWADFHDMDRVVEKGVAAAESVLPTLLKARARQPL